MKMKVDGRRTRRQQGVLHASLTLLVGITTTEEAEVMKMIVDYDRLDGARGWYGFASDICIKDDNIMKTTRSSFRPFLLPFPIVTYKYTINYFDFFVIHLYPSLRYLFPPTSFRFYLHGSPLYSILLDTIPYYTSYASHNLFQARPSFIHFVSSPFCQSICPSLSFSLPLTF